MLSSVGIMKSHFSNIIIVDFHLGSVTCLLIMVTGMHFILWSCLKIQLESGWFLPQNSCHHCILGYVFSEQHLHVST